MISTKYWLGLRVFSFKVLFSSHIRKQLLTNEYQTSNSSDNEVYQRHEKLNRGFLSESEWFAKHNINLKYLPILSDAKITSQPVTIECGKNEFQTWHKLSEIPDLDSRLEEVLINTGYNEMSPIQRKTFDILNRRLFDFLGLAETGSGKTLAFLMPIFNNILSTYPKSLMDELRNASFQFPMILIIAPTRELVRQTTQVANNLLQLTSLRICDVIGGVNVVTQMAKINNGCHSIIGTPGRLMQLIGRGSISLKYCKTVVFDEADRLFDMGFESQIRQIMNQCDLQSIDNRQTAMFSATFPEEVMIFARTFLKKDYGTIIVGGNTASHDPSIPEGITQSIVLCDQANIFTHLFQILNKSQKKIIVFCNTKRDVESVERILSKCNIKVAILCGSLIQQQRDLQLMSFKTNQVRILVATTLAARGLDVFDVECVVNYGVPKTGRDYVHRVGRCGRMGRVGEAITLVTMQQLREGSIARDLVQILNRTKQHVPDFLQNLTTSSTKYLRALKTV